MERAVASYKTPFEQKTILECISKNNFPNALKQQYESYVPFLILISKQMNPPVNTGLFITSSDMKTLNGNKRALLCPQL